MIKVPMFISSFGRVWVKVFGEWTMVEPMEPAMKAKWADIMAGKFDTPADDTRGPEWTQAIKEARKAK